MTLSHVLRDGYRTVYKFGRGAIVNRRLVNLYAGMQLELTADRCGGLLRRDNLMRGRGDETAPGCRRLAEEFETGRPRVPPGAEHGVVIITARLCR